MQKHIHGSSVNSIIFTKGLQKGFLIIINIELSWHYGCVLKLIKLHEVYALLMSIRS